METCSVPVVAAGIGAGVWIGSVHPLWWSLAEIVADAVVVVGSCCLTRPFGLAQKMIPLG